MIYEPSIRRKSARVLGVRPGSGRPSPFGTAPGFDLDDELGQEAAEVAREVAEAKAAHVASGAELVDLGVLSETSFKEFDAIVSGATH